MQPIAIRAPRHLTEGTLDYGTWQAFCHYQQLLEADGAKAVDHSADPGKELSIDHLLWMCKTMRKNMETPGRVNATDKISRWLGFVQAGLISHGLTSVVNERNRTRPWFENNLA